MPPPITTSIDRARSLFLWCTFGIFVLTACAKLAAIASDQPLLSAPNSVFSFATEREVALAAALLEIAAAAVLMNRQQKPEQKTFVVALVATLFLWYKIILYLKTGGRVSCLCLGSIFNYLPFSKHAAETITRILLGFLLGGSYILLLLDAIKPAPPVGAKKSGAR